MKFRIVNTMVTCMLFDDKNKGINLGAIRDADYEPEQFPGAIIKKEKFLDDGKSYRVSFLVFENGKINIGGCKSESEINEEVKYIEGLLEEYIKDKNEIIKVTSPE